MHTPRTAALALAMLLAACTGSPGMSPISPSDRTPDGSGTPSASAPAVTATPGSDAISIADAIASAGAGPVLVFGSLVATPDGQVRLCAALLKSLPPQCGGASLLVPGLDLTTVPGLQSASGVIWGDRVELLGVVEGETLSVASPED